METIKISAVIITFNEEVNIDRCLRSLKSVADEIIVVDSNSSDRTEQICKTHDVKFYTLPWQGYSTAKNFGNEKAGFSYILSIDADEELSEELQQSIITLKKNSTTDSYQINRITNYCDKWIRHGGWYPEWKIRLFKKEIATWQGVIHEQLVIASSKKAGKLSGNILHYSYPTIESHLKKVLSYSTLSAQKDFSNGKKYTLVIQGLLKPFITFMKMYVYHGGFMDGYYGFIIAMISSFERFVRYAKFKEFKKKV